MMLAKKILNKLNGLHFPQEYLCIAKESFQQPLFIYITENSKVIKDITQSHLFVGYCPLIFAFYSSSENDPYFTGSLQIRYSRQVLQPNDILNEKDAIAWLSFKLIRKQANGDLFIIYYQGIQGGHRFLSPFHQFMIDFYNQLYNKKPGNVFLSGNLYRQVQIAYSISRIISLVTTGKNDFYNLFPTDLHGSINNQYYILSLRTGGKACEQVEASGKIVISSVHTDAFQLAYSLGKNHMQDLKQKENFQFSELSSSVYQLPLPNKVLNCLELELKTFFDQGIHRIFLFKIVSSQDFSEEKSTLAHIHNVYATWLHNKGLRGNYLL